MCVLSHLNRRYLGLSKMGGTSWFYKVQALKFKRKINLMANQYTWVGRGGFGGGNVEESLPKIQRWRVLICPLSGLFHGRMRSCGKQMVTFHAWNVTLCFQSAGKNHQTKTRARSTRLCLEENQKTNLDPPYPVCPKLQVQAAFYCQRDRQTFFHKGSGAFILRS